LKGTTCHVAYLLFQRVDELGELLVVIHRRRGRLPRGHGHHVPRQPLACTDRDARPPSAHAGKNNDEACYESKELTNIVLHSQKDAARVWPCAASLRPGTGGSAGSPSQTERAAALLWPFATGAAAGLHTPVAAGTMAVWVGLTRRAQ